MNHHKALRGEAPMQTAVGRDQALASAPTFSRLENRATRTQAVALHGVLVAPFMAGHTEPLAELVMDPDGSDVPLHGAQELSPLRACCDDHRDLPR